MQQAHRKWWVNYNSEHHQAHQKRQDGRYSPSAVLRGMLGRTYPEEVLSRVLYATQFTRHLDRHGYVRFKHWRFFGEDGLAGRMSRSGCTKGRSRLNIKPPPSQNILSAFRPIINRFKQ